MSGIENYIRENIEAFDAFPVPEGSKGTFMKKMKGERSRRRLRTFVVTISSIAAAAALVLFLVPYRLTRDIERQHRKLALKEVEILTLVSETAPEVLEEIQNTIRMVTTDAIPLEEQLPKDMQEGSKKKILKEYYEIKYKALETILEQYTETY